MQKLLFLTPHLSTGGLPQYLLKKIELLKNDFVVYVIEYANVTTQYRVQRDKIEAIVKDRFYSLPEKHKLPALQKAFSDINPDIVHLEEHPECFWYSPDEEVFNWIYRQDRRYLLIETCHNSIFNPANKKYYPDKFIFVSSGQAEKYKPLNIPIEIIEYPIEDLPRTLTREEACQQLELDPAKKHILNVGLFTKGKNQGEALRIAKRLVDKPYQFHFVGNMAVNFEEYWKPLIESLPPNCKVWGERSDVEAFYQAADLFLFTSKLETNPLVVREAISWKLPVLMYNLPIYGKDYVKLPNTHFLDSDLTQNINQLEKILS